MLDSVSWMKPVNEAEIQLICENLERSLDGKFQKAHLFKTGFVLELHKKRHANFLILDLNPQAPYACYFERACPVTYIKEKKPFTLFLNAHAKEKRLVSLVHQKKMGRVLEITFGFDDPLTLQVRLFPHGQNIIVNFKDKQLCVFPPKELPAVSQSKNQVALSVPRTVYSLNLEWQKGFEKNPKNPVVDKDAFLDKKRKAIDKIEAALQALKEMQWDKAGDWLKTFQSLHVPTEFKDYVDRKKSFSKNLDLIFTKAKETRQKIEGTLKRLDELRAEYAHYEAQDSIILESQKKTSPRESKGNSGLRTFQIGEDCRLFIGRNAQENLKILREAQSWDYWLHLKDYPGAHGILKCPRHYTLSPDELETAAQWIAERSKKSHHQIQEGDTFEVIVTQKRFVKPIKGDSLGRVRYSDEKTYTYKKRSV